MSVKREELCFRVERDVLDWLLEQLTTDEIEEVPENFLETGTFFQVTDEMLDALVEKNDRVLAVFCKISHFHISTNNKQIKE